MNPTQEAVKEVRHQIRKEGRWKFPAAFAAAMLGLSVFISLLLVLSSRADTVEVAKEAKQEAAEANQRIIVLEGQLGESQEILTRLNSLLEPEAVLHLFWQRRH